MKKERTRRIEREEEEWILSLVAICQRLYWECSKLPSNVTLSNRQVPTPRSKYGSVDDVAHLDDIMVELMNHFSKAPPEVDPNLREAVFQLQQSFDNPDTEAPLNTNYFKTDFRRDVEQVMGQAARNTNRVKSSELPL